MLDFVFSGFFLNLFLNFLLSFVCSCLLFFISCCFVVVYLFLAVFLLNAAVALVDISSFVSVGHVVENARLVDDAASSACGQAVPSENKKGPPTRITHLIPRSDQ